MFHDGILITKGRDVKYVNDKFLNIFEVNPDLCIKEGGSVDESLLKELVERRWNETFKQSVDPHTSSLQDRLTETLGTYIERKATNDTSMLAFRQSMGPFETQLDQRRELMDPTNDTEIGIPNSIFNAG